MIHTLNLNPEYFEKIKKGEKIYEGRLNDEKRKTFNVGDQIQFFKVPERVDNFTAIIIDKLNFSSFEQMAEALDKNLLGFKDKTNKQMIETYRSFYSKEDEQKYGVVVFKIKV